MQPGTPITEHRFASGDWRGTHLTLYPGRLLHDGGSVIEHMPLAHVAAVRIEFSRDGQRLKWAVIFLVLALFLAALASPLHAVAVKAADVNNDGKVDFRDAIAAGKGLYSFGRSAVSTVQSAARPKL